MAVTYDHMSGGKPTPWLARSSAQFARTVYAELRRARHADDDILRFVNEMMDLLSRDADGGERIEPPALLDPEAGIPDRDTIQDVLEFELRRAGQDRRPERLVVVALDVVLPTWTSGTARQHAHEVLSSALSRDLRASDSMGLLGGDRYLLLLARAKQEVVAALGRRLEAWLESADSELPDGTWLELRWAMSDGTATTGHQLLEACFACEPQHLAPRVGRPPPPRQPAPVRIGPREVVLALGGGAARAASHAGVLRELAGAEMRAVGVAGCSAGGIVGAMFVRGATPDAIVSRFAAFASTSLYREMRRAYGIFLRESRAARRGRSRYFGGSSLAFYSEAALSVVSSEHLYEFVEYFVGPDCAIGSLPLPFSVVATDLIGGRPAVLSHGSLHAALTASCAVPGLFPPQQDGERLLVDGSTVSEVPIWAARVLGPPAPILAVYMDRPSHRIADYQNSAEVATRSNALVHAELVREQLRRAEFLISVPVQDVAWLDFRGAVRIAEIGREAAQEALPRILARMDDVPQQADADGVTS